MNEAKKRPVWKRVLVVALKIYAVLCTMVVTAFIGLLLWSIASERMTEAQSAAVPPFSRIETFTNMDFSLEVVSMSARPERLGLLDDARTNLVLELRSAAIPPPPNAR